MIERTAEDIALGVIRLSLGERQVILKTLPWEASDEWHVLAQERLGAAVGADWNTPGEALALVGSSMEALLDLVVAYDRDHVLATSAADIRRTLDRSQVYEVFKAIARHEFPFLRDAATFAEAAMPLVRPILFQALSGLSSRRPASSNGSPVNGASTPEPSEPVSIASKSASSGKQARSV